MNLKKIGVALLAVFVMGAIVANSAYAENEYSGTGGQWYTETSPGVRTKLGTGVTDDLTVSGGPFNLVSTIASKPIKFSSTGVTGTECSAINPTTTTATLDCKALVFTGVTVSGEAATGCTTESTITTKEITTVMGMNNAGTLQTYKLTPKTGAGTTLGLAVLNGTCANAGTYKITGAVFAQATNATGVFASTQELTFSEAIQKSAGTPISLKFGENGAFLNGSLQGTATKPWAGQEK